MHSLWRISQVKGLQIPPKFIIQRKATINSFKPAPALNNANFPNIKSSFHANKSHQAWKQLPTQKNKPPPVTHEKPINNNELLNSEELLEAFEELWVKLKSAHTIELICCCCSSSNH